MEIAAEEELVDIQEVCPVTEDPAAEELVNLIRPEATRATVLIREVPVEHLEEVMSPEVIMEGTTIPEDITEVTIGTIIVVMHLVERPLGSTLKGQLLGSPHHGGLTMPYRCLQPIMIPTTNIPILHLPM